MSFMIDASITFFHFIVFPRITHKKRPPFGGLDFAIERRLIFEFILDLNDAVSAIQTLISNGYLIVF